MLTCFSSWHSLPMHTHHGNLSRTFSVLLELPARAKTWQWSGSNPFASRRETPLCVWSLPPSWARDDQGNSTAPAVPLTPQHLVSVSWRMKKEQNIMRAESPQGCRLRGWRECSSLSDVRPFRLPPSVPYAFPGTGMERREPEQPWPLLLPGEGVGRTSRSGEHLSPGLRSETWLEMEATQHFQCRMRLQASPRKTASSLCLFQALAVYWL